MLHCAVPSPPEKSRGDERKTMVPDNLMMKLSYHWLHIPTGKTGVSTQRFTDRGDFLRKLANWNRDPRWKYWEVS